jgi:hypothetical protein
MKTAIRSSTFWWALAFLIVVIAPTRSGAAGAPSATPTTDDGQAYFLTWIGTARGSESGSTANSMGAPLPDVQTSTAISQGSAVVKFDRFGSGSLRALRVSESYQYDYYSPASLRLYNNTYVPYGPWHDRESLINTDTTNWAQIGSSTYLQASIPYKRADGTWWIRVHPAFSASCLRTQMFPDLGAPCIYFNDTHGGVYRCPSPQASKIGVVACSPSREIFATDAEGKTDFVLEANTPSPDYFSKHAHYVGGAWRAGYQVGPDVKPDIDWTITARRIGKCLVGNSIPIKETTNQDNPDINDEDIEMGVEHGSDSIDPDSGIAAMNLRLTCDQVPIENANVTVKVEVQKNTGGHTHAAADRPRGSLNWNGHWTKLTDNKPSIVVKTDDDGRVHLTFKPGKAKSCPKKKNVEDCDYIGIAGIHRITATPVRFPLRKAEVAVEAKVDGLSKLDADPKTLVDDVHGDSHTSGDNATATTKSKLVQFASDFQKAQDEHNQELGACPWPNYPLWVIDVSLPFGGLYDDVDDDWAPPHQTHGHGDGVDFSVKERSGSPSSATKWPPASATTGSNSSWVGAKLRSTSSPACPAVDQQGWLIPTMMQKGEKYGNWDSYDLCQHPNVCAGTGNQPWVPCCPDNVTCPSWHRGVMGPEQCPGWPYPAAQCLHCPTPVRYHLHVRQ